MADRQTVAPVKPPITKDEFDRVDIRVGTIELVEDLPETEKLVRLTVNFGDHKRTILSGMKKERADFREIQGKQGLFVINIEPRKIRGEVSQGMIFDIGWADGIKPVLAVPERRVPDGVRAG